VIRTVTGNENIKICTITDVHAGGDSFTAPERENFNVYAVGVFMIKKKLETAIKLSADTASTGSVSR
jgi:hypothetical protein